MEIEREKENRRVAFELITVKWAKVKRNGIFQWHVILASSSLAQLSFSYIFRSVLHGLAANRFAVVVSPLSRGPLET